jgi:phage replication O-like protein O
MEDGFTRIANELFDAILGANLTVRELSVVMAIIRKTYGYNKKQDDISASQIGLICGLARTHVTTTLKKLEGKNIIHKRIGTYGCVVGIQKDHALWCCVEKKEKAPSTNLVLVPIQYKTSTNSVQVDSTNSVHTKDNLPKDNQKTTRNAIALRTYLDNCKTENVKPIPESDPVFKYASEVGIPEDFLRLQWLEFRDRFQMAGAKRYKSWPQAFGNSVRSNWYKLWFANPDGSYALTTTGQQAARLHGRTA